MIKANQIKKKQRFEETYKFIIQIFKNNLTDLKYIIKYNFGDFLIILLIL
jgi:hypothetical protein